MDRVPTRVEPIYVTKDCRFSDEAKRRYDGKRMGKHAIMTNLCHVVESKMVPESVKLGR